MCCQYAAHPSSPCMMYLRTFCVIFYGLESQSHCDDGHVNITSSPCPIRAFVHARPTMSCIPLVLSNILLLTRYTCPFGSASGSASIETSLPTPSAATVPAFQLVPFMDHGHDVAAQRSTLESTRIRRGIPYCFPLWEIPAIKSRAPSHDS